MNFGTTLQNSGGFNSKPTFGFGTQTSNSTSGFGALGTQQQASTTFGFGSAPSNTNNFSGGSGLGFGSSASTGFGKPNTAFGSTNPSSTTNGFGSNQTTSLTAGLSSFGAAGGGFGSSSAFGQNSSFGGFGAKPTGTSFGSSNSASGFGGSTFGTGLNSSLNSSGALGSTFGTGNTGFGTNTGINSFGASTSTSSMFGGMNLNTSNPQFQQQQPQQFQEPYPGASTFLEFQRCYASFVDSNGRPVSEQSSQQPTSSTSIVSSSFSLGGLGSTNSFTQQQQQQQKIPNPNCQFDTILYNIRSSQQTSQSTVVRPAQVGYQRWRTAELENPDPNTYEPSVIVGPIALKKRFESQQQTAEEHILVAQELSKTLLLSSQAVAKTEKRCENLKEKQAILRHKLLTVMCKLEVLRLRGMPVDINEHRFRERVDKISKELRRPQQIVQQLQLLQTQLVQDCNSLRSDEKALVGSLSDSDLNAIYSVLQKQQQGIQHLVDIITKDERDMKIVSEKVTVLSGKPVLKPVLDEFYRRIG